MATTLTPPPQKQQQVQKQQQTNTPISLGVILTVALAASGAQVFYRPVLELFSGDVTPNEVDLAGLKEAYDTLYQFVKDNNICGKEGTQWLQAALHDAGTYMKGAKPAGGLDGSLRYELNRAENRHLRYILDFDFFPMIRMGVSLADITALAGAASVHACGGPAIPLMVGRTDVTSANPGFRLPFVHRKGVGLTRLKTRLYEDFGMNAEEAVAIVIGSYTIGGPAMEESEEGFDSTPHVFDNEIFKSMLAGAALSTPVDNKSLMSDDKMKKAVIRFANDQNYFFAIYAQAYHKLTNLGWDSRLLTPFSGHLHQHHQYPHIITTPSPSVGADMFSPSSPSSPCSSPTESAFCQQGASGAGADDNMMMVPTPGGDADWSVGMPNLGAMNADSFYVDEDSAAMYEPELNRGNADASNSSPTDRFWNDANMNVYDHEGDSEWNADFGDAPTDDFETAAGIYEHGDEADGVNHDKAGMIVSHSSSGEVNHHEADGRDGGGNHAFGMDLQKPQRQQHHQPQEDVESTTPSTTHTTNNSIHVIVQSHTANVTATIRQLATESYARVSSWVSGMWASQ
ncbi:hypothetical protein HK102_004653 [Quaeritorhiza haematococci]|nr:hypothetical protein HK102_004653 [Quaeritorhiza haematococci]